MIRKLIKNGIALAIVAVTILGLEFVNDCMGKVAYVAYMREVHKTEPCYLYDMATGEHYEVDWNEVNWWELTSYKIGV